MSTMQPEPVIFVIDDDEAVRQSLEFLLKTAGMTARGFESATAFLEILPQVHAGCIITDVRMPDATGIDLLRRVKELGIDVPVIVITGHGDISLAVEAMKIGAIDFLEKPFDDDQLIAAVRAALSRDADVAKRKAELGDINDKLSALSKREREVLPLLLSGIDNEGIGNRLYISIHTVKNHVHRIYQKTGAGSRFELLRIVREAASKE